MRPRVGVTFDVIRGIALKLPDVKESTAHGAFAIKVRGKLLACRAIHKSAEPNTLVVCIDFDQRDALLAELPQTYYVTDHYVNYPSVLVRLSQIDAGQARDLLNAAWRFVTSQKKASASKKPKKLTTR